MTSRQEIFSVSSSVPIQAPPFPSRNDHPVPRTGITDQAPISTNKFYANMFLGTRTQPVWIHPFSVWWSNGAPGSSQGWGLSVSHTTAEQRASPAFGPDPNADPVQYYFNPTGIQSLCLSAMELGPTSGEMTLNNLEAMSVEMKLGLCNSEEQNIKIPLIQGSGFISALYNNLSPKFTSTVLFRSVSQVGNSLKWRIQLEDGNVWLLYAFPFNAYKPALKLHLKGKSTIESRHQFDGLIQVTKVPRDERQFDTLADPCAGTWANSVQVSAYYDISCPSKIGYTFDFRLDSRSCSTNNLLMYALPHHVESLKKKTHSTYPEFLQSTTKGVMTAIVGSYWNLQEDHIFRDDFCDMNASSDTIILSKIAKIASSAREEALGDPTAESNLDSMYFAGKALDKYACLCWVICAVLKDTDLAQKTLSKLKEAFSRFAENRQRFPLTYESAWGGLVSTAMYETGDLMMDFGNGCYNDHHFHYGYFIHTAAFIAKMDDMLGNGKDWLNANKPFVDTLVRDTANVNPSDKYFPVSRAFDWFHGHSWAKGLFESWDGKDQESTSEDAYFSYGLKLWGSVIGDNALEQRANLMLAVQKRAFRNYFLLQDDNQNQPRQFVKNKVTGILFENKVDHTTYFGNDIRFIQGIHMIPVSPVSRYIRWQRFVREEWKRYFAQDPLTGDDGWKGILYSNYAIIEPNKAWNFFAADDFKRAWLDGGATQTWYLALCAHFMGSLPLEED
ncbi:glycoside hydrolase family 81 protein [Serendipita vermifera MAFF 305830]|uniref:glucan endo-1,3-beta-D-glucosidase n=1 Tax=Serendipita vermifera MAFF 305830 TaxID=933852 RepID=A0A0C3BMN1_SERVB|nr:glycoside hydrolase family 81 protein [Serendipita vermifera MAFF 305830]